jgi:hypothetical protein
MSKSKERNCPSSRRIRVAVKLQETEQTLQRIDIALRDARRGGALKEESDEHNYTKLAPRG